MKSILRLATAWVAVALLTVVAADAALIDLTLGEKDFNDGDIVFPFSFTLAAAGEPAPFDAFRGNDVDLNDDFSETFSFGYAPIVDPLEVIISASIEFGITDHDAAFAGSQLASFLADGSDLTAALNMLFEASGGANNEYNVFSVALPVGAFMNLRDGAALFSLDLQGPTPGLLDPLPSNGAGLDFARLRIETQIDTPPPEVAEPSTTLLLFGGLIGLISSRRRAA